METTGTVAPGLVEVAPGTWRWLAPDDEAAAGTAVATPDGLVLIDPPAMAPATRARAGRVAAVLLTSVANRRDARSWRAAGATVWAPVEAGAPAPEGIDRPFVPEAPGDLPGGLRVGVVPGDGTIGGDPEVAYLWGVQVDRAGVASTAWLLATGRSFPVAGQVPYFDDGGPGGDRTVEGYLGLLRALQALGADAILPAVHLPLDEAVVRSTGYAGHVGRPSHARRAAPVTGPRLVVGPASRVLGDAIASPVIRRRADDAGAGWIADPWACTSCGVAIEPLPATCGGPPIPRQCAGCRQARRGALPDFRVMVCGGGCCTREGARAVVSAVRRMVGEADVARAIDVVPVSCIGECSIGPFVRVADGRGVEPTVATRLRDALSDRARDVADELGERIDADSEAILARWIPMVRPSDGAALARDLVTAVRAARG